MADRILGRLLRPLEKVYKFPGAQKGAPDSFELDLPIQPVHDVSRMASVRSATGPINDGFWNFTSRIVHAGASILSTTPSPWSASVANGFPEDRGGNAPEVAWWIYNIWVTLSSNSLVNLGAAVVHGSATVGPYITGASAKMQPLIYCETSAPYGVGTDRWALEKSTIQATPNFPLRVMDNPSGLLPAYNWYQSQSTGPMNVDFNQQMWMGPAGVMPPGM